MDNQAPTQQPVQASVLPQNPTTPSNPPMQPMPSHKSKKTIIIMGVIVLLLVIGAGGHFLGAKNNKPKSITSISTQTVTIIPSPTFQIPSPTPEPTKSPVIKNSQQYLNTKYNYSLTYPSDWIAKGVTPGAGDIALSSINDAVTISPPSTPENPQVLTRFGIEVTSASTEGNDYDEWVEKTKKSQFYRVTKESKRIVGDIQATTIEGVFGSTGGGNMYHTTTFLHTPDNKYYIVLLTTDTSDKASQEKLEDIISSFKFPN